MEEQIKFDESTMIKLRPESIREKHDVYTSLTDLYGVEVFTNEFIEQVNQNNAEKAENKAAINALVFSDSYGKEDTGNDKIYETLFKEDMSLVLIQDYNNTKQGISALNVLMVGISIAGVILLYGIFWAGKRGGRKRHAH